MGSTDVDLFVNCNLICYNYRARKWMFQKKGWNRNWRKWWKIDLVYVIIKWRMDTESSWFFECFRVKLDYLLLPLNVWTKWITESRLLESVMSLLYCKLKRRQVLDKILKTCWQAWGTKIERTILNSIRGSKFWNSSRHDLW